MSKQVAATIRTLAMGDDLQRVMNRSEPVDDLVATLLEHWSYDLYARKPGPALVADDGALTPTDLDLACFLSALADRHAVISLPTYTSRRAPTHREGERVLSKENRHGPVIGLSAHKECFSFSVRVLDQNVIQAGSRDGTRPDQVGAPRNFMLMDVKGQWYEGWKSIEFMPSAKENEFLHDKKLWTGHVVYFQNFVHPNRWVSFFGQYYLLTKLLCQRLTEEAADMNLQIKRMLEAKVKYPTEGDGTPTEWPATETGESVPEIVKAFEVEIDAPGDFVGTYPQKIANTKNLVALSERRRRIVYTDLPKLRFATRATELAFHDRARRIGPQVDVWDPRNAGFPGWIQNASWVRGYIQHGKRTQWHRLVLAQTFPGRTGLAIRCRSYDKTERVAP